MSRITREFLQEILREYTKNPVESFTCESACEIGSNFTSEAKRVTVIAGNYLIKLIVKEKLTNIDVVAKFKLRNAFLNEARAYFVIIPELQKILSLSVPHCLYADENTTVLNDLSAHGYKTVGKEGLTLNQIKDVLRELAKLHSTSFILSVRNKAKLEELSKLTTEMVYEPNNSFLETQKFMLKTALEIFRKYDHPKQRIALEVLENLLENSSELLCEIIHKPRKFKVLTHGDCWENNILIQENSGLNENSGVTEEIFTCKQYFICTEDCRCKEHSTLYCFASKENSCRRKSASAVLIKDTKENKSLPEETSTSLEEDTVFTKETSLKEDTVLTKENSTSLKEVAVSTKENSSSTKKNTETSTSLEEAETSTTKETDLVNKTKPKIISVLPKKSSAGIYEAPIKLIDFQAMRFTSVAADLSYFLYVNKTPAFRGEHLPDVLGFYLESLRSYLRCAGVEVRELTEDWLGGEMREFRVFGFVNSLWLLPVRYFRKEDLVMNEYSEEDQDRKYRENFWEKGENSGFLESVRELVLEYIEGL